jgi:hypothetical protein
VISYFPMIFLSFEILSTHISFMSWTNTFILVIILFYWNLCATNSYTI